MSVRGAAKTSPTRGPHLVVFLLCDVTLADDECARVFAREGGELWGLGALERDDVATSFEENLAADAGQLGKSHRG